MISDRLPIPDPSGRLPVQPAAAATDDEQTLRILEYLQVLRRRWPWILAITVVATAASIIYTVHQPRVYRAVATVEISYGDPSVLNPNDPWGAYVTHQYFLETQYQILQSKALAQRALEDLGWLERADWKALSDPAAVFAGGITVEPDEESYIVLVGYEGFVPEDCRDAANAIVGAYIRYSEERRRSSAAEDERSIFEQANDARARLDASQRGLQAFVQQTNILSFTTQEQMILRRIGEIDSQLNAVRSERVRDQARVESIEQAVAAGAELASLPDLQEGNLVPLRRDRQELGQQRQALAQRYRPDHPEMRALDARIAEADAEIERTADQIVDGLRTTLDQKQREERELTSFVDGLRAQLQDLYAVQSEYESKQQEVEANGRVYNELTERLRRVESFSRLSLNNVALVDPAETPSTPIRPSRRQAALLALVLGLIAGIVLALVVDVLDDRVRSVEQVEQLVGAPSLGALPTAASPEEIELVVDRKPQSPLAETFRTIRAHLLFTSGREPPACVIFTSSEPQDGKTTVCSNAAAALALGGDRVLLIDGDLRKPKMHRLLSRERQPGLTDFLLGETDLETAIRHTDIEGLDLFPAGKHVERPSELLNSPRLAALIETARAMYDRVVIDAPPSEPVADARVLARFADRTILIVSMARSGRRQIQRTAAELAQIGAPITGCVINHVDQARSKYYNKAYYYYAGVDEGSEGKK